MIRSISIRGLHGGSRAGGGARSRAAGAHSRAAGACARATDAARAEAGFTLIELMIVMAIIGILSAIAIPSFVRQVQRAKEAALKEDLHTMRSAIDSYTVDKQQAPQSLDDLVQAGYMKVIPKDPMTNRNDTWITSESDTMTDINQTQAGLDDVHSGSQDLSSEGTSYNTW